MSTDFQRLHGSGCFVLPNAWDAGSAVMLRHLGFPAIASTSGGYAFSRARPDGGVALADMLEHLRDLVSATPLPVNADFENGYADEPEDVSTNVTACVATGVAGLSIEDRHGAGLYERGLAVERIRAARAAIDASGLPVVLTARCEAHLVREPDAERVVLDRLVAFAEAGADCLYAPGLRTADQIAAVVSAAGPLPVNVLAGGLTLTVEELADLGVRRISLGSGLARAAWAGFLRTAREIADHGTFTTLAQAEPFADLNRLFAESAASAETAASAESEAGR
jgi:2-methylisocitrate lyase-like PEP mutase family enzyme